MTKINDIHSDGAPGSLLRMEKTRRDKALFKSMWVGAALRDRVPRSEAKLDAYIDDVGREMDKLWSASTAQNLGGDVEDGFKSRTGTTRTVVDHPCGKTLQRWICRFLNGGSHAAALVDRSRKPGELKWLPKAVQAIVDAKIRKWMSYPPPDKKPILDELNCEIEELNASSGSDYARVGKDKFNSEIDLHDLFDIDVARQGEKKALALHSIRGGSFTTGANVATRYYFDCWEIHTHSKTADIICDNATDKEIAEIPAERRIAYAMRSACGRTMAIHHGNTENEKDAIECLRKAFTGMATELAALGLENPLLACATAGTISFDQQRAFATDRFRATTAEMGLTWERRSAGTPKAGAVIETHFRRSDRQFSRKFPGYAHSNAVEVRDHPGEKAAALSRSELWREQVKFSMIQCNYTRKAISGGRTPAIAWNEATGKDRLGTQRVPERDEVALIFGIHDVRKTSENGVFFQKERFLADEIDSYRAKHGDTEVPICVDPHNLGWILVRLGQTWVKAYPETDLRGVTLRGLILAQEEIDRAYEDEAEIYKDMVVGHLQATSRLAEMLHIRTGLKPAHPSEKELASARRRRWINKRTPRTPHEDRQQPDDRPARIPEGEAVSKPFGSTAHKPGIIDGYGD